MQLGFRRKKVVTKRVEVKTKCQNGKIIKNDLPPSLLI